MRRERRRRVMRWGTPVMVEMSGTEQRGGGEGEREWGPREGKAAIDGEDEVEGIAASSP
jgi:hypothetical protein